MTGRARASAAIAAIAALAVALTAGLGCTGDDDAAPPSTTSPAEGGRPHVAPAVFGRVAPKGWSWVGATDDALVGLGGRPDDVEAYGQVVDLATGAVDDIDPLPDVDGRPAEATAAVFRSEDVVVTAVLPPAGGYPPSSDQVPDVEAVSFRLDPTDGSWTVLDGPDLALGTGLYARLDLVGDDDGVLASFARGPRSATARARLDDDAWTMVRSADPDDEAHAGRTGDPACTTEAEAWQAVRAGDGAWDRIAASSLDRGASRTVSVPGLRSNSVDAPLLGCATDLVVVGQMDGPDGVGMLAATTDRGATWSDLTEDLPEGRVVLGETVAGGSRGIVVRAHLVEPGDDGRGDAGTSDASLVVGPDGGAARLDVEERSTPVVWRGSTGDLLALERAVGGPVRIRTIALP